jgi:hypothetical protein
MEKQDHSEKAQVGYQVATNLWAYEGQLIWSTFSAMLLANSIILPLEIILYDKGKLIAFILLAFAGVILCLVWLLITVRGFAVHDVNVKSAREIEEKYLNPPIQTVGRGEELRKNAKEALKRKLKWKGEFPRISELALSLRAKWLAIFVIGIFLVLHFSYLICLVWISKCK